jgi:hypothetical protein
MNNKKLVIKEFLFNLTKCVLAILLILFISFLIGNIFFKDFGYYSKFGVGFLIFIIACNLGIYLFLGIRFLWRISKENIYNKIGENHD